MVYGNYINYNNNNNNNTNKSKNLKNKANNITLEHQLMKLLNISTNITNNPWRIQDFECKRF